MVFNFGRNRHADSSTSTAVNSIETPRADTDHVYTQGDSTIPAQTKSDAGHVPAITFRTIVMTILVALGGFIFGYDTGQISGFLEMPVFLERFGQQTSITDDHPTGYYFTNVRSGLIVGLVCLLKSLPSMSTNVTSCLLEH